MTDTDTWYQVSVYPSIDGWDALVTKFFHGTKVGRDEFYGADPDILWAAVRQHIWG